MDQKKGLQRTKIVREQSSPYCKLKFVRQNWRTSELRGLFVRLFFGDVCSPKAFFVGYSSFLYVLGYDEIASPTKR